MNFLEGRLHEDIPYTIPLCLCADRVAALPYVGYYYRQNREGSIMSKVRDRNVQDFANAVAFSYKFLKEKRKVTPYIQRWVVRTFMKSCLSHKTTYVVLKKSLTHVEAPEILLEIANTNHDNTIRYYSNWFKSSLFVNHSIVKFRYIVGRIIHYRR